VEDGQRRIQISASLGRDRDSIVAKRCQALEFKPGHDVFSKKSVDRRGTTVSATGADDDQRQISPSPPRNRDFVETPASDDRKVIAKPLV
jgi:hypothetical protein